MITAFLARSRYQPKANDHEHRLDYIDGLQRVKSTALLFVGSLLGLLGFIFAAFLGYWNVINEASHVNFRGKPMDIYFPATVSEMVYNSTTGSGKCFFAFVLIGGICMLMSWYPWALRNVYIGDDKMLFSGWIGNDVSGNPRGIKVLMLRQFLPPIGIMMVACIPAPPAANRLFSDTVSSLIHTLGATMSIGGYAFIELATLTVWSDKVVFDTPINGQRHTLPERTVRLVVIGCCIFSIVAFQVAGVLLGKASMLGICCADEWAVPTSRDWMALHGEKEVGLRIEDEIAAAHNKKLLLAASTGSFRFLKLCEYWFEVLSGLFMLVSHMLVWFYCPERFVDLNESLPDPDGHDGQYERM